MEKCCTKCGMSKDLSQFQIRRASKDGLSASCKSCLSIYEKKEQTHLTAFKQEKTTKKQSKEKPQLNAVT